MSSHTVIIGDSPLGEALARAFADGDAPIVLLADEEATVSSARSAGIEAVRADPTEPTVFDSPEVAEAGTAVVAARTDGRSLLVAQLLRTRDTDRVVALVHDPRNVDAFADAGVDAVCATTALATALVDRHDDEAPGRESTGRGTAGRETTDEAPGREPSNDTEVDGDRADDERRRSDGGRSGGG